MRTGTVTAVERGPTRTRVPPAPEAPPATNAAPAWPSHRTVAGVLAVGFLLWVFGDQYKLMFEPQVRRYGHTVIVPDFFQEWFSARQWLEEKDPYAPLRPALQERFGVGANPRDDVIELNAHPPAAIVLALPFGLLDFRTAFQAWNLMSLVALALSWRAVAGVFRPRVPRWAVVPLLAWAAFCFPFWNQMIHGQLNLVLLWLVVGAWQADREGRAGAAGCLAGVALSVKLFPGFLLVYFALAGRWRAFAAGCCAAAAVNGLAAVALGPEVFAKYLLDVLPQTGQYATVAANQSLSGLWLKTLYPVRPFASVRVEAVVVSHELAAVLAAVSAVAVTWYVLRVNRWERAAGLPTRDRSFSAAVVATLLVSPLTWDHYFLLLLLPVTYLLTRAENPAAWWAAAVAAALLTLSPYEVGTFALTLSGAEFDHQIGSWYEPPWVVATLYSLPMAALLGLFALLVAVPDPRPGTGAGDPPGPRDAAETSRARHQASPTGADDR